MIVGDRVNRVEAEIKERKPHNGIKLSIVIKDLKKDGNNLLFEYEYTTFYDGVGYIKVFGDMLADEDEKTRKELIENWTSKKKISKDYMERLLNTINYTATAHATLIARVLSYPPPLIPPKLGLKERKKEKPESKK